MSGRRGKDRGEGPGAARMFAMCVPGLAPLASRELAALAGVRVTDTGFDGRSDVVLFEARDHRPLSSLRTVEDVFIEVGRTLRADGDDARWIAQRTWRPQRVSRALAIWAESGRPSPPSSFRVVARVLQERSFLRSDLRRHVTRVISDSWPAWAMTDPAQLEVWITEYARGKFVEGLRLSDARMRQHDGRAQERKGALRPTVAAAMVGLAGEPAGMLLDPCCGSGTILREAAERGFLPLGVDLDPAAVEIARKNTSAPVEVGDVRSLDIADEDVAACVSNLPFGRQFAVPGDAGAWVSRALAEMARVTRPGGRVVVLAPRSPTKTDPRLRLRERHGLRLLGARTAIWAYDRL